MADPTTTEPQYTPPPQTPEEHSEGLVEALNSDPELLQLYEQAFPDTEENPNRLQSLDPGADGVKQSEFLSGFDALAESQRVEHQADAEMGTAAVKGVLKAGAGILDFATNRAVDISKATGIYQIGRDEEEEQAFLKWYEESDSTRAPAGYGDTQLTNLDTKIDNTMGPTRGGIPQFVEGATQFAVGMAGAGRMLTTGVGGFGMSALRASGVLAAGSKALANAGRVGAYINATLGMTLRGALSDATFFNPWEAKLADMIESGPEFLSNPVTRYLQADANDSEAEARLKRALEGAMLGTAIDGFVGFLRVLKVRVGFKTGALKQDEAEALMEQAGDALEAGGQNADDLVRIVETGDGRFAVEGIEEAGLKVSPILEPKPKARTAVDAVEEKTVSLTPEQVKTEQETAELLGPEPKAPSTESAPAPTVPSKKRMVFTNMSDAQAVAATLNYSAKNRLLPAGRPTEEAVGAWKKALEKYEGTNVVPDAREMGELLEDYGFNVKYAQQPQEVLNVVKALVDASPEAARAARMPRTHNDMLKAAQDLFPGTTGEDALVMAERVFGATQRLPEELLALRAVLWSHGRALRKLSQLAHASPHNKLAVDQLAAGLDTLQDLHAFVSGAQSNNARALNVGGIPQGKLIEKMGDNLVPARAGVDEVTNAAGKPRNAAPGAPASPAAAPEPVTPSTPQGLEGNAAPAGAQGLGADEATNAARPGAKVATPTPPLSTPPTPKPGAQGENIMDAAANAPPEVQGKAMSEILKEWQAKNPGVIMPTGNNVFTTRQGLKQEMAAWEKHLADLKSRPDRAANAEAIKNAAAKMGEISGMIRELDKQIPKNPKHLAPMGRRATEGLTADQIKSLARNVFMADGDPAAILWALRGSQVLKMANKTADRSTARKLFDYAMTIRVEGMLSAATTHVTNITSSMQTMLTRPMEYWWAGWAPQRVGDSWTKWEWSKHPELRQEGSDMLMGIFAGMRDSWTLTKKAFMTGQNVLDPMSTVNDGSRMLMDWNDSSWMQKIVHMPSRLLMAGDELFKNLNYRTSMRAQILRLAREQGVSDPAEIAKRLIMDMQMSFGPGGAVNPRALEYARTNTFTNPLEYGWGKSLQEFAEKHPTFRIIMPFIRTPTNIFRYVWQRTPLLNRFQEGMKLDLAAGGERAALARAKTAMGVAIWGTGAMLVSSGVVTGKGPSDPDLRRQMQDNGWQPYSIRIGDRYVSYRKADPVATSLGMIADLVQISGELRDKDQKFYVSAAISAIISNLANKSYMQGMVDLMDGVSSGDDRKMQQFFGNLVGSFIPNILRRSDPMLNIAGQNPGGGVWEDSNWALFDDNSASPVREARGFIDGLMSRIPGFSSTLEPHRNILGEKVMRPPGYLNQMLNPFTISGAIKDESIQSELVLIGKAFTMPAPVKFGGMLDLRDRDSFNREPDGRDHGGQSPYDRMLEIMAKPPGGQPSLREALTEIIRSPEYKNIPGDDAHGKGGLKHDMIQEVVSAYQEMAFGQVLSEYSVLEKAYLQAIEVEAAGKANGKAGVRSVMEKYEGMFDGNKSPVQPQINWR